MSGRFQLRRTSICFLGAGQIARIAARITQVTLNVGVFGAFGVQPAQNLQSLHEPSLLAQRLTQRSAKLHMLGHDLQGSAERLFSFSGFAGLKLNMPEVRDEVDIRGRFQRQFGQHCFLEPAPAVQQMRKGPLEMHGLGLKLGSFPDKPDSLVSGPHGL